MTAFFQMTLKIFAAAGLLVLACCVLFVLNALRIAVYAYRSRPIRRYYRELAAEENFVPRQEIPADAETILIATEDYAFLSHHGFSFPAMLHAMRQNQLRRFKKANKWGGSGITQQLVKNLYLNANKTYTRKLAELFLSVWVESRINKYQILELYFNIVYFGSAQYGIGPAARFYMNAEPRELSMNQLVSLICILPNPDRYNPLSSPELFQKAREITLHRLLSNRCISEEYARELADMPWNAHSGEHELRIVRRYLTKNPCYRKNIRSKNKKYVCFHQNGPRGLMLHSVGCAQSEPFGFLQAWNRRSFQDACVHAFIDAADGTVYQTLPWDYRGWHCGGEANNSHIGVELCESESIRYVGGADFEIMDPDQARRHALCAYDSAVRLVAVLCQSYHLDSSAIISHCEGSLLGVASDHKDPEHLWAGLELDLTMDRFRADVKEKAKDASLRWISGPPFKKKHPFWKRLRSFILNG